MTALQCFEPRPGRGFPRWAFNPLPVKTTPPQKNFLKKKKNPGKISQEPRSPSCLAPHGQVLLPSAGFGSGREYSLEYLPAFPPTVLWHGDCSRARLEKQPLEMLLAGPSSTGCFWEQPELLVSSFCGVAAGQGVSQTLPDSVSGRCQLVTRRAGPQLLLLLLRGCCRDLRPQGCAGWGDISRLLWCPGVVAAG